MQSTTGKKNNSVVLPSNELCHLASKLNANCSKINREEAHCVVFHQLGADDIHFPLR